MLSRETDFVSGEHPVGADDHSNARDQSGRPGLVVRISHADHAAVSEVVAVADRDGPEEPVSSVGEQATRVLNPVAPLGDLILHPVHQDVVGQGSPAERGPGGRYFPEASTGPRSRAWDRFQLG